MKKILINSKSTPDYLTEEEERKMDLISNAVIDLILLDRERFLKIPLFSPNKDISLRSKG